MESYEFPYRLDVKPEDKGLQVISQLPANFKMK